MVPSRLKGYVLGVVAASTYGMNPLFALPLYADGMDANSVLFLRYAVALPVVALMIKVRGRNFRIGWRAVVPLFVLGVVMGLSSLGLFVSYGYMDAGIASTILFVYPLIVALIMAVGYRQRLSAMTWGCLAAALVGIMLLYHGEDGATLSLAGTIMVIAASVFYAAYMVGINQIRAVKDLPTLQMTFYVLLFGLTVFAVPLLLKGGITLPRHPVMWGSILALAVLPTAVSLICTTVAIQHIGPTPTAILGALEPVTAVAFGVTVFGERLSGREIFGLVLILAAVCLVIAGGGVTRHLLRFRKMFPSLRRGVRRF